MKKSITTDSLLDKLEVIKIALQSNLSTLETGCKEGSPQKRAIEITKTAVDQIDDISSTIKDHGFFPGLEDLHRIVNRAIISNRLIVKDPNRIRAGDPVLYSSIHPEFPLDLSTIDQGKDAVIINVRKSKGNETSPPRKAGKRKPPRGQKLSKGVIPADNDI